LRQRVKTVGNSNYSGHQVNACARQPVRVTGTVEVLMSLPDDCGDFSSIRDTCFDDDFRANAGVRLHYRKLFSS